MEDPYSTVLQPENSASLHGWSSDNTRKISADVKAKDSDPTAHERIDINSDETPLHQGHGEEETSDAILVQETDLLDKSRVDIESSVIDFICHDNAEELICILRRIGLKIKEETQSLRTSDYEKILSYWFPHRLLHLACQLDSDACAQALLTGAAGLCSSVNVADDEGKTALHYAASNLSIRCVQFLLHKRAKADIQSNDGLNPLMMSLQNKRWPNDLENQPANEIIRFFRTQDLTIIKLLADQTKGIPNLAFQLASDGHSISLTALILAKGDSLLGEDYSYELFLDTVVEKAISSAREGNDTKARTRMSANDCVKTEKDSNFCRRSSLKCLEIIVCLKEELVCTASQAARDTQRSRPSALLRAAEAGDEAVIRILLIDKSGIHETDADGNTALHWCLKTTKELRIIWQLVTLGSGVASRNKLGYTPVHNAAENGHIQALQLLLAQDPNAVHITAITSETPLFLAVKNNHIDCARLLLQFGSNSQALNLRKQRPVDFANSQDMRMLLAESGLCSRGNVKQVPDSGFCITALARHQRQADQKLPNTENGNIFNIQSVKPVDGQDLDDANCLLKTQAKTALCRYHMMPGGCARGEGCFYAHTEPDSRTEVQEKARIKDASNEKKIFVGGLSPAIESGDLKNCFEAEFGPVEEAIVMSTQIGNHIQSRGFGFVTFVKEESCIAAVRQHYLIIYGKRVEIKAAFQPAKRNEDNYSMHCPSAPRLTSHAQEFFNDTNFSSITKGDACIATKNEITASQTAEGTSLCPLRTCQPPWLAVFKRWLPAFLAAASARQRGGECYPLSSVKADFRATCGMELDHASLGFPKLSDFLRTMPELCKMKIVPVGRGPATHVVLQVSQANLASSSSQTGFAAKTSTSSFVHEGRTYAAAAGQNIITSSGITESQKRESHDIMPINPHAMSAKSIAEIGNRSRDLNYETHTFTDASCSSQSHAMNVYDLNSGKNNIRADPSTASFSTQYRGSGFEQIHGRKMADMEPFTAWQQEVSGNRVRVQNIHQQPVKLPMWHDSSYLGTPANNPPRNEQNLSSILDMYNCNPYIEQNVRIPPRQNRLSGYKEDTVPYNPWNFNIFDGCRNLIQQMNLAAIGEESPQSTLTSDDSIGTPFTAADAPAANCVVCGDKAPVWIAFPCAHKSLCESCKCHLDTKDENLNQCFICRRATREWILDY
ncbi:hypothetical protein KP509_25G042600 [Ceratopteris richardii]|uniref:Uncharacterized protein n=1 Tax=Ceratopteris richardii TaxID=49495 RepID=A0A8T2RSD5_CERRI|nr:hypothetical protein KP509_25G042600 [Ceratopteris richardii]KAH7298428.1 hypothetical protein KP509_25G042600 [Ceratopteris richardii]